eukprot:141587-Rhodomonas_salina.1
MISDVQYHTSLGVEEQSARERPTWRRTSTGSSPADQPQAEQEKEAREEEHWPPAGPGAAALAR